MRAFVFDPLWDELATDELLQRLDKAGIELSVKKKVELLSSCRELFEGSEDRVLCLNPDYVNWKLSTDDYKNIPNLKGIFAAATSFSWIDRSYADENDIAICNIRNFSTEAVAEWAITMMFNVARQTPRLIKASFPLDFDKDFMKYRGIELHGKTVGIVGLGNIGAAIGKRCSGLGMNVTYWSKSPKDTSFERKELADLMSESDVIFPAMALNDETKNLITPELIRSMKPSAMLISVVHELFDEKLVLDMVNDGRLFGFGFEAEPASFNKYEGNVWAAPAYAWVTDGSMNNSMEKWVDNMVDAAQGSYPNRI